MMMAVLFRGKLIPVPTVERAQRFLQDERVPLEMLAVGRRFITGSPRSVRAAIEDLAGHYGAQEVFLVNILHRHTARRRSYELLAAEFQSLNSSIREHTFAG
jgi:alkanesulfonate monooxygenase SsuD/methylene tetrahydromethanopterin reductase-like flavin-dependent oxidoreductase (luciferase family)